MKINKTVVYALVAVILLIGAVLAYQKLCVDCLKLAAFKPDNIRNFIQGFGNWAILVYVLLYIANTITLLPPIAIMSLSAGFLFGPIFGTIALTLGAFCGTSATFFISRYLGGHLVERVVRGKAAEFNEKISKNGFIVLLPIRLIGFPPYEFVNYACGLSKISYKDYISATMIGMSPAIIIQVLLADRVSNFDPKDPLLYIAVAAFIAMGVITTKIIKKKQTRESSTEGAKI